MSIGRARTAPRLVSKLVHRLVMPGWAHGRRPGRDTRRFRRLRFSPLRDLLPWVAVAVGIALTIRAATGGMGSIFFIAGPALCVLGDIAFFVFRWMGKRGF